MRYNKYQSLWIKKLISGTTRKAKGALFKSNRMCCLGVAESVCGFYTKKELENQDKGFLTDMTKKELNLRSENGSFNCDKLNRKWKNILLKWELNGASNLAVVNDCTNLSHVQIGQMINENREVFFKS